jgi:hypothetical protein
MFLAEICQRSNPVQLGSFFFVFDQLVPFVLQDGKSGRLEKSLPGSFQSLERSSWYWTKPLPYLPWNTAGHSTTGVKIQPQGGWTQDRVIINTWDGLMLLRTPVLINCAPFYENSARQFYENSTRQR